MNPAPRLIRLARQASLGLALSVLSGFLAGILVVFQASLTSQMLAGAFLHGWGLAQASLPLVTVLGLVLGRAGLAALAETASRRAAIRIKSSLRAALIDHILGSGPAYTRRQQTGELAAVIQEGVDGLEGYYSLYLPQLALAALVPLTILVALFPMDLLSGMVLLLTAPLIPLFMILIGKLAERQTRRQWLALSRLSAHFLDALQGLVTLKAMGRARAHAAVIDRASQRHRQATMAVLRITFLSALTLELIATLSTALLAVEIALRLMAGRLDYGPAMLILLLAPEFYLPLRTLGTRFHAGESGLAAARRIFAILEAPASRAEDGTLPPRVEIRPGGGDLTPFAAHADPAPCAHPTPSKFTGYPHQSWKVLQCNCLGFTYPGSPHPALAQVTCRLAAGQHTALVGPSGAGKSTLLWLLLRFAEPTQGGIRVDQVPLSSIAPPVWREHVAWVPQTPHLFQGTLEENLRLARQDASMTQIREAARSARLDDWIAALPLGYETRLTDLVSRLSAGELQRLALARAFLRDAPLLLLDEHTAFLDPELEDDLREILSCLTRGRTTLTIAHRLETVVQADQILVLEAGRLVEAGSHPQLLEQQGVYARLVHAGLQTAPESSRAASPLSQGPDRPAPLVDTGGPIPRIDLPRDQSETRSPVSNALHPAGPGQPPDRDVVLTAHVGHKTTGALQEMRRPTFLRLLGFVRPYWKGAALATLLSLAAAVCAIGLLGTSAYLLSAAALRPSMAALQVAIVGVRFFGLGRGAFRYLERWGSHEINFRVLAGMRGWFYRRLEPLAPARLLDTASGDLLGRAVADISTLEEFYLRGLSPAIVAALTAGGMWLFWQSTSPPLANTFAIFSLLAGLALPLVGRWMARHPAKEEIQARAGLGAALVDSLQGLAELAACNRVEAAIDRLKTLDKTYARAQRRSAGVLAWQAGLSSLVVNLAGWTNLALGIAVVESGQIPGLLLAAILMSTQAAMEAVLPLPQAAFHLEKSLQSARRLFALVDRPPEVPEAAPSTEKEHPAAPHTSPPPCPPLPATALNIRGLSFSYGPGLPLVFDGLHFALLPGERVGLVGPSGVGKTTLASLLLRFWDFQAGEIELDGQSIRQYSPQEIHARVAVLPSRAYLFSITLRQNLLLANPSATSDQLTSALNQACLGEWVSTLPGGLDTWIGEHGLRLSAGERQRLALARFFLQDAPLVVLDEPFANLDAVSVSAVWQAVLDHTCGRTILVITHRLQGMEALDRVAVLRGVRIVEEGHHTDLLARRGFYRKMWDLQHQVLRD